MFVILLPPNSHSHPHTRLYHNCATTSEPRRTSTCSHQVGVLHGETTARRTEETSQGVSSTRGIPSAFVVGTSGSDRNERIVHHPTALEVPLERPYLTVWRTHHKVHAKGQSEGPIQGNRCGCVGCSRDTTLQGRVARAFGRCLPRRDPVVSRTSQFP